MPTTNTEIDYERAARLIENMEQDLRVLRQMFSAVTGVMEQESSYFSPGETNDGGIEGIFDGEHMVDVTGKTYQVSANYASKSKLVEGDPLKLYITPDGKFFYKQLGPVERKMVPGTLRAEGNRYVIDADDGNSYEVLTASVTYYMSLFNVQAGDRVMIMIPADHPATWAVIDNVL